MRKFMSGMVCLLVIVLGGNAALASITGNPAADGWTLAGNSLQNGIYVTGAANYSYDAYGAGLTVQAGSNLVIADGTKSWLVGDTVLGAGGKWNYTITPAAAGWAAFSGGAVNDLLPPQLMIGYGPKLQAKFGTSLATWSASTIAPGAGNGISSGSAGGGRVQIRTGSSFTDSGHTTTDPYTWDVNTGQLLTLASSSHIEWANGSIDKSVARMIWEWDPTHGQYGNTTGRVGSWELLLNVSLLDRLDSSAYLLPAIGDDVILTVQNIGSAYTDALVTTSAPVAPVPEPGTIIVWSLLGLAAAGWGLWRRKRAV